MGQSTVSTSTSGSSGTRKRRERTFIPQNMKYDIHIKLTKHEWIMINTVHHILKVDIKLQAEQWHNLKTTRIKARGLKETTAYLKALYTLAQRFTLDQPFQPIPFTKSDSKGFPSCISSFKNLLRGSPNERRAALTVLAQYRLLHLPPEIKLESIESKSN